MRVLLLLIALAAAACAREPGPFVAANAQAHVNVLAGTIGSRPAGSAANARAREYIVDELERLGFDVRVQQTDARRQELGLTARVSNIIAVLPGERPEALGLVTHYDSSPHAPGAADAALGVAVALESARALAALGRPRWSLFILMTDGEELGLLGAAGLVTDREVVDRLRAYINLDAVGSSGTSVLFESGPGNGWLVAPWARYAPHPRGGSFALEIYRRLPNDTDFSILKTRDLPGLNFAPIGDSYAYHTARDTADRLSGHTIRTTGENVVTLVAALQDVDITARSPMPATFFDVGGVLAVSYGPRMATLLAVLGLLLGAVAWMRHTVAVIRQNGFLRWILTFAWAWAGAAFALAAMIGITWLLRSAREVYHPWYAHPGRLFALIILAGVTAAWTAGRAGGWLPARLHPVRHPSLAWSIALPAWIGLAAAALWIAPAAQQFWTVPLLSAGIVLALASPDRDMAVRLASLVVLAASAPLWIPNAYDLLGFAVAVLGRLPIVTPVFVYAVVIFAAAVMLAPPLVAMAGTRRPAARPWLLTSVLLLATTIAFGAAYLAPAYTEERPLRRIVRALQEAGAPEAIWEAGSVEPGLELGDDAPPGWTPTTAPTPGPVPWRPLVQPFVFRTNGPPLGDAPLSIPSVTTEPLPGGVRLRISVVPREEGLTAGFVLPPGIAPVRSNLPGISRGGRWTALFAALPPEGIAWEASFDRVAPEALGQTLVSVSANRLPGGSGWQGLPAWLPQDRAVWSASATWAMPAAATGGIAPVPPLR